MQNKRYKNGIKIGLFGIIINLVLGITKIILSYSVNSVSIMTDAFNNITDMTTSLLTIIGFKLTNKKPTKKHPYGYARYEYISSFLISIFMIIMSIYFMIESISKIIKPENLNINKITYIILFITLILKIIQLIYYLKTSKNINSMTLKATSIETRNDIITNISILFSMFIMSKYNINIDGFIALIVSIILITSSIKMFNETLCVLVGTNQKSKIEKIERKLFSYKEVKGIHNLCIHNYGVNIDYITAHLEVKKNISINKLRKLINQIELDFRNDDINISVQIEPIIKTNKKNHK